MKAKVGFDQCGKSPLLELGYYKDYICPSCGTHTLYMTCRPSLTDIRQVRLRCGNEPCSWHGPWVKNEKRAFKVSEAELEAAKIAHAL